MRDLQESHTSQVRAPKEARTVPASSTDLSQAGYEFMPATAYELIDWLDEKYPPRSIKRNETLEDAHRLGGQRDLIDALKLQRSEEIELAQSVDRGTRRRSRR